MSQPADQSPDHDPLEDTNMTLGDHLEELRARLLKSLYGLALALIVCLIFGDHIFAFLAQPLLLALHVSNLQPELYVATLPEAFMTYLKVCLFAGIFLASPWIFHQIWSFVAAGLYPHERRYVRTIAPFSCALFLLGGLFFIWIVAPLSCQFFIRFGTTIETPQLQDNFFTRALIKSALSPDAEIPKITPDDPCAPESSAPAPLIKPIFTLQKYVSLILKLALAFSLAFQMPLVVFFLGRLRLVTRTTLTRTRKYVFLAIVIVAALMTPPDVISQLALALPMYLLYELGIILLRFWPPKSP